nr:RagB/SusD family nutrient uptake outer membrane protein [Parabacteroides merdae]
MVQYFSNYSDRVYDSSTDELIWKTFYNHLKAANSVLSLIDPATEDASLKIYRGQALAARAYDYLNLVQIYQFTYAGHENALAVPIVTERCLTKKCRTIRVLLSSRYMIRL